MHVQNEPRDQYGGPTEAVPAPRSSAEDDDTAIVWARDPEDRTERLDEDRRADEDRAETDRVDEGRADEGRADEGRADEGRVDEGRVDEGRVDDAAPAVGVAPVPGATDETARVDTEPATETEEAERADEAAKDRAGESPTAEVAPASEEPPVAELTPGDAPAPMVDAFWADGAVDGLRARWREVQLRFVDDPQAAAREAEELVGEAVDTLTTAITSRRDSLTGSNSANSGDTEELRMAIRRYREFLDRMLDL